MPRLVRLTHPTDLERVRHEGKRVRVASIEARATPSLHGFTRVGVIVPRYGRSAVERNRLKRRLREVLRREWLPAWRERAPLDVVVRVLPPAYARTGEALRGELAQLAVRVDRLREGRG